MIYIDLYILFCILSTGQPNLSLTFYTAEFFATRLVSMNINVRLRSCTTVRHPTVMKQQGLTARQSNCFDAVLFSLYLLVKVRAFYIIIDFLISIIHDQIFLIMI